MTWSGPKVYYLSSLLFNSLLCLTGSHGSKCEVSRNRCAYRAGCGMALQNYIVDCAPLIIGQTTSCPAACERALIALLSTEEGEALIDCDCDSSEFCETNKQRIQVCRQRVLNATAPDSVVSCLTARSICMADLPCSTALTYYYERCRPVFRGKPCSRYCRNALNILNRQPAAGKLRTCYCEGGEDFGEDCQRIKETTEELCIEDIENSIELMNSVNSSHTFTVHLCTYLLILVSVLIGTSLLRS